MTNRSREATIIVSIVTALAVWWAWGAADPLPVVLDEYAYVLQAKIFATGHWTVPSPPLPEFFQQAHVLTTPAVASKFPPGHSLLLAPGALVGAPSLMVLVLSALFGALFFALVRRVTKSTWIAAFAWGLWLSDPINLRFRPGYYSEVTSSLMCLITLWSLLEWRETRRRRWLIAVAAAIGWGAVTRPLTMLGFAVPVGIIVIRDVWRRQAWRDFSLAALTGVAMLAILPLWSARTTGDWKTWPITQWRRDYMPYDKPGFGVDTTPPARELSPVARGFYAEFYREHVEHQPANLPRIIMARLEAIAVAEWSGPRLALAPFVIAGLFAMNASVAFGLACAAALFIVYLSYGHFAGWTLYYFEAVPILSVLGALGLWRACQLVSRPARVYGAVAALLVPLTVFELASWRRQHVSLAAYDTAFQSLIAKLPARRSIVFIHYGPQLGPHASVVANSPTLGDDAVWVVHDLGARNAELLGRAPDRVPFLFNEQGATIDYYRPPTPSASR